MIPKQSEHISDYTVRITSENLACGSGILFINNTETFIITARHCIIDELTQKTKTNLKVDFWDKSNGKFGVSIKVAKDEIFYFEDSDIDLAVLKINLDGIKISPIFTSSNQTI